MDYKPDQQSFVMVEKQFLSLFYQWQSESNALIFTGYVTEKQFQQQNRQVDSTAHLPSNTLTCMRGTALAY